MAGRKKPESPPVPMTPTPTPAPPPDVGDVARQIMGAMVAKPPFPGTGSCIIEDERGRPIYRVLVILGPRNIQRSSAAVEMIKQAYPYCDDLFPEDRPEHEEAKPE